MTTPTIPTELRPLLEVIARQPTHGPRTPAYLRATEELRALLSTAPADHSEQPSAAQVAADCAPGVYAILYRDNWDGQGDECHLIAEKTEDGKWLQNDNGYELLQYEGDAVLLIWSLTAAPKAPEGREDAIELLRECRGIVAREVDRWTRAAAVLPLNANVESSLLARIDAALSAAQAGGGE